VRILPRPKEKKPQTVMENKAMKGQYIRSEDAEECERIEGV
jgi:hypothetical protein